MDGPRWRPHDEATLIKREGGGAAEAGGMFITGHREIKRRIRSSLRRRRNVGMVGQCQQVSEEIARRYKGKNTGGKAKIAVVEFSDLSGDRQTSAGSVGGVNDKAI